MFINGILKWLCTCNLNTSASKLSKLSITIVLRLWNVGFLPLSLTRERPKDQVTVSLVPVPRSRMVEPYLHSLIYLCDIVLN